MKFEVNNTSKGPEAKDIVVLKGNTENTENTENLESTEENSEIYGW